MSYDSLETSASSGAPIEVYKFTTTAETYRYTNSPEQLVVNGETYFPITIVRDKIKTGTQLEDSHEVVVSIPYDEGLVQDNAFTKSSPSVAVEIRRAHYGSDFATESKIIWKGRIASTSTTGRTTKIKIASNFSTILRGNVPGTYYQNNCNHVLFDSRCKLLQGAFQVITFIGSISGTAITVDSDGNPDGDLVAGIMTLQRTNESRMIISNIADVVTIASAFSDAVVGDSVILIQGCDHSFSTCASKFSNTTNYGGHPYVPGLNPFEGEV